MALPLQAGDQAAQGAHGIAQRLGHRLDRIGGDGLRLSRPQAIAAAFAARQLEALAAPAAQLVEGGHGLLPLFDVGQGAHRRQHLHAVGRADLLSRQQDHHAKGPPFGQAALDHVQVADLEHAQAQDPIGEQGVGQGKQGDAGHMAILA